MAQLSTGKRALRRDHELTGLEGRGEVWPVEHVASHLPTRSGKTDTVCRSRRGIHTMLGPSFSASITITPGPASSQSSRSQRSSARIRWTFMRSRARCRLVSESAVPAVASKVGPSWLWLTRRPLQLADKAKSALVSGLNASVVEARRGPAPGPGRHGSDDLFEQHHSVQGRGPHPAFPMRMRVARTKPPPSITLAAAVSGDTSN